MSKRIALTCTCPHGWPWHFTVHMDGLNTLRTTWMALTLYCSHGWPWHFTVNMDGLDTLRSTWMTLMLYGSHGWPWRFTALTLHMFGLDTLRFKWPDYKVMVNLWGQGTSPTRDGCCGVLHCLCKASSADQAGRVFLCFNKLNICGKCTAKKFSAVNRLWISYWKKE